MGRKENCSRLLLSQLYMLLMGFRERERERERTVRAPYMYTYYSYNYFYLSEQTKPYNTELFHFRCT